MKLQNSISRRSFLNTSTGACLTVPAILLAKKSDSKKLVIGEGDNRFEVHHDWAQLPDKYKWQTTHYVAVDKTGNLYVIHEGRANLKDHPSIFVFDPDGKFVRAFGNQFQGGGHGLEVREEGKEEFLYVCAYQNVKAFAKLTLKGETVWEKYAPMDSGVYRKGEDGPSAVRRMDGRPRWGRDAFLQTNFAYLDDGGFLLADGYGSFWIHRYDKDGNWVSKFGGPGRGEGKFNTPHGIWIDRRPGLKERVVICDRAHHTVQLLTLEGKYLETIKGYGMPANIDTWKNLMMVPELHARVTLLDEKNKVVAQLGDDIEGVVRKKRVNRGNSKTWINGKFVHPHDACFGANGDIYVAEWVATGRITKLRRLG